MLRNALLVGSDRFLATVAVAAIQPFAPRTPLCAALGSVVAGVALAALPAVLFRSLRAIWPFSSFGTVLPVVALEALGPRLASAPVTILTITLGPIPVGTVALAAVTLAIATRFLLVIALVLQIILVEIVALVILVAAGTLVLDPRPILTEHAEIMVGELEVIFGLDAVAGELRVASEAFVLFEQLRRIAALPVVAGIAPGTAGHAPGRLPTTTAAATSTTLAIIHQILVPCRTGALGSF